MLSLVSLGLSGYAVYRWLVVGDRSWKWIAIGVLVLAAFRFVLFR